MKKQTKLLTAIFAAVFAFSLAVSCGNSAESGSSDSLSAKESLSESTEESLSASGNETESASDPTESSESDSAKEPEEEHTPSKFEEKKIKTSQLELNYILYTPADATENMPLIVYLHGGSGKGNDLSLLYSVDGFPQYVKEEKLGDIGAYVIMPQLPKDKKGWTDISASLRELIGKTISDYKTDAARVSLTGHSMGGTGTWGIALAYPEVFSCIAPMSGSLKTTDENVALLKDVPVWAFVGSADTIVSPQYSIDFVNALKSAGGDATLTTFDGADHFSVPSLAYLSDEYNVVSWLTSHRKAA